MTDAPGYTGWPHVNSDAVLQGVASHIRRHQTWPTWPEHPEAVAETLIAMGTFTRAELTAAGYRKREEPK